MARQYTEVEPLDIVLGEPLPWNVYAKNGFLLLKSGAVITRQDQLDRLIASGLYAVAVEIEETRQTRQGAAVVELPSAWLRIAEVRRGMEGAFTACKTAADDFLPRIETMVALLEEAVAINPNVVLASISLKAQEPAYSRRHPVDVACVLSLLCSVLDKSEAERRSLLSASLTMNFAQFETQDLINKIPGLLPADSQAEIRAHPTQSAAMLQAAGVSDALWLEAVLRHHERYDGGGYPNGLTGDAIGDAGQLLAMADWYCARSNQRADRASHPPGQVVRLAQKEAKLAFHPSLPMVLLRAVGMYPVGSMVKLSNGEVAVVGKQAAKPEAPLVYTIKSPRGALNAPIMRETHHDAHTVRDVVDPSHVMLDKPLKLTDFYGKDAEGG